MLVRGNCTICTDFFGVDQDISVTFCGHLFHELCLSQWLRQCGACRTCPQCRTKLTPKQVVSKLYINVPDAADIEDDKMDPFFLQNELNEYQAKELTLLSDKKKLKDALKQCRCENNELQSKKKSLEKRLKESKDTVEFLNDQLKLSKEAEHEAVLARNEAKRLRDRLTTFEKMEFALEAGRNQVDEMIQQYTSASNAHPGVKQLATICVALKQEYETVKTSKNITKEEVMRLQKIVHRSKQQLLETQGACEHLKETVSSLQRMESQLTDENKGLRRKLEALQNAISSPSDTRSSAISRLLLESPAPLFMTPDVGVRAANKQSKRFSDREKEPLDALKKPKLSPSDGCCDIIDLVEESESVGANGSFICEAKASGSSEISVMRDKTNFESPVTLQTKKVCEEMGLKFVKTMSSIRRVPVKPGSENKFFRKPLPALSNNLPLKLSSQSSKLFASNRINKVPMSSKAKPFSSKPMPASSLRPKISLVKKLGPR